MTGNLPPADAPEWGGPYNWEWFKFHHWHKLEKGYVEYKAFYNSLENGKALSQESIKTILNNVDPIIELISWLPAVDGGQGTIKELITARNKYKESFLDKEDNHMSYWEAQEIYMKIFSVYNYMSSFCED